MPPIQIAMVIGVLLLIPKPAWAFGPAAHLDFGLHILRDLAVLAPLVSDLLRRFPDDFLYGNLAPDITIGKNLSPYQLHCHNWQVGFSVLDLANDEATQSFAWGYLSHLAADVVAHNYFVPYKIVASFQQRTASHTYWEVRYDTRVDQAVWRQAKRLSGKTHRKHDQHLKKILTGPLFPFPINKQLFSSMMLFSRLLRWQRVVKAHARHSPRILHLEEVQTARSLSIERIRDLLTHGDAAGCLNSDPTGHRNLLIARDLRNRLRALYRQGQLIDPHRITDQFRPLFLDAIDHKLDLPSLIELTTPGQHHVPARKPKGILAGRSRQTTSLTRKAGQKVRGILRKKTSKKHVKKPRRPPREGKK